VETDPLPKLSTTVDVTGCVSGHLKKASGSTAPARGIYAALLAAFGADAASVSSHLTETNFETPGSCIVTP